MKIHRESTAGGGGIAFGISVPHSPRSIFTADQARKRLYHCVNDQYMIEVFDENGDIIRRIDRPYESLPFTSGDVVEFRARYAEGGSDGLKKMLQGMAMPTVKNITPRILVDDGGNL